VPDFCNFPQPLSLKANKRLKTQQTRTIGSYFPTKTENLPPAAKGKAKCTLVNRKSLQIVPLMSRITFRLDQPSTRTVTST